MHELSVAQGIVDYAADEAAKNGAKKVTEIGIEVGELTRVDSKVLADSLTLLLTGPVLEGCRVEVESAAASFVCRGCSHGWGMSEANEELDSVPDALLVREPDSKELALHFLPQLFRAFIHCPSCGSSDITTTAGDDIRIRRLVLD